MSSSDGLNLTRLPTVSKKNRSLPKDGYSWSNCVALCDSGSGLYVAT